MDDQPFSVIDGYEFRDMILYLRSSANIPSANTVKRDLNANFDQVKVQICQKLQVIIKNINSNQQ